MTQNSFPWRLFARVVGSQTILLILAIAATGVAARYFFKKQFLAQVQHQLQDTLKTHSHAVAGTVALDWCRRHAEGTDYRFTVVHNDGSVLCDSQGDALKMENHADRPEIAAARASHGFGSAIRTSSTVSDELFYEALDLGGHVLRVAVPLRRLNKMTRVFDYSLVVFLSVTALIFVLFALLIGRQFASPIGRLLAKAKGTELSDQDESFEDEAFGELSELESSIKHIQDDLKAKSESLREEREELATLMSSISDAILAVDADERLLFLNSRFEIFFRAGRALGDNKSEARLWEIFREPEIIDAYRAALKEGRPGETRPIAFEHDGHRRFFTIAVAPLRRQDGKVYAAVGVFHDVTDLKLAEQIRIDFVANVSHELRTPLTSIKGYADTVKQDLDQKREVEPKFIDIILRNTDRLIALINDLLDLSSLESSLDALHKSKLSTREITERVLQQLQDKLQAKKQKVDLTTSAASVTADSNRLEQVLVNLIDNASKYSPSGSSIKVEWAQGAQDVVLSVENEGPGIPLEHQSRLFERFYRVDKARSREMGGTGLGLAIVKHIMQRHGGAVWVESENSRGARFSCRFPS